MENKPKLGKINALACLCACYVDYVEDAKMTPLLIPVIEQIIKILPTLFPDREQQAKAQLEVFKMQQEGEFRAMEAALQSAIAQAEVNKVEAANSSLFVSGWRPGIGWVLAVAMAYQYIARPLLIGIGGYAALPSLDGSLFELVTAMLGLAGLRSYEKAAGVAK